MRLSDYRGGGGIVRLADDRGRGGGDSEVGR